MSVHSRRRLFSRKDCTELETHLISPTFVAPILINEISLEGLKAEWKADPPPSIDIDSRVRITLPVSSPQQIIILGGQIIWATGIHCGIQIFYTNCTTLMYQKALDQIN